MKKSKLTVDEQELVIELFRSEWFNPLFKLLEEMSEDFDKNVLRYHLDKGPEGLVIEKARSEGVKSFVNALNTRRREMLKKDKKEK